MLGFNGGIIGTANTVFTGTKSNDPNYSDVSLLLNGNDFTDSSRHDHTLSNTNITVDTTTKKYGTGSLEFSTSAYGTFPHDTSFDIGTGDFTIEAWVYPQNSGTRGIAHNHPSYTGGGFTFWIRTSDNKLVIENFTNGSSSNINIVSGTSVSNGTWAHVAYSRSGGTGYLFVNGNQEGTHQDSRNLTNNSAFYIGAAEGTNYRGIGYIDDLRFTVGVARYTSNFTPPTAQLPDGETGTFTSGLWTSSDYIKQIRNELWPGLILPIVTDGLVVHLDAGNSASYPGPGSGTTWYDLSGNGNDATLYNTPTHNASTNGGIFSFNNSQSEYATIPGNYSTTTSTVIAFARYTNTSSNGRVISANNNWLMGWWSNQIDYYHAEGWVSSSSGSTGTTDWICYAATGDYSADQWELYKNGTSFVGPNANGSQGPNTINLARSGQYGQYADCKIGVVLVYNRILTASEITQNFNALKGRYGL